MQKMNALLNVVLGRRGENPITANRINQGVREGMENMCSGYFLQMKLSVQADRWMKKRIFVCSLLKTFYASLIKLPKEWSFLSPNWYGEG